MTTCLIFPPRANATYVPLGLACLSSYLNAHLPDHRVTLLDLSIDAWHRLLAQQPDADDFLDLMGDRRGSFYDPEAYEAQRHGIWSRLNRAFEQLSADARDYLETDRASAPLAGLLTQQLEQVLDTQPCWIGLSLMYPRQLHLGLALAKRLDAHYRALSQRAAVTIALGGALMSGLECHDLLGACPFIDVVHRGEGEEALRLLLTGAPYDAAPGLSYRADGGVRSNPKQRTFSLKALPAPDFSALPLDRYLNPTPVLPVAFSRGCAWSRCRFCAHNFSFAGYRRKDVAAFVGELAALGQRHGARHFYFADQYLSARSITAIAQEIVARGLDLRFHFMARPLDDFEPGAFELLHRAGCRWISWGVESASPRLLETVNKGTSVAAMGEVLAKSAAAGISNLLMMIFGLPGSTEADLQLTIDFLASRAASIDGFTESSFVLFKGSEFGRDPRKYGLSVTGPERLCTIAGRPIRSHRLFFTHDGEPGGAQGSREISQLAKLRRWCLPGKPWHGFNAEHCLLYVSGRSAPASPLAAPALQGLPRTGTGAPS